MTKWKKITINDLVQSKEAELQTGPFGTQLKASEYVSEGIPVINVKNIGHGAIVNHKLDFLSTKTAERLHIHRLEKNDIIFGRKGAVDRHGFITKKQNGWIQGSDCLRLRIKSERVCNKYLSYYFTTESHKSWMEAQCSFGATMSSLNQDIVKRISLPLPPLPIQRKIAAVLSTYDDLIENNTRRIAILEQMAEEIYREWFVRMRFPGHERVKFQKGVPEGWELRKVQDSFEISGGGTPSKKNPRYWQNGDINWYTPSDLTKDSALFSFGSSEKINFEGLQNSSAKLFPPYSLMMTSRATIGVLSINTTEACTNQGFITCLPNEQFPLFYLYYWLKTNTDYFIQLANGATFLEITKGKFKKIKILMPASPILQQYCRLQQPHFEAIKKLFRKLENLKTARNLLLSRLMSCKLTVDDLDICFPSSMQAEEAERPESGGPYHDLDHLAGGWSIEASEEFNRNTAMFEEIYDITV